MMARPKKATTKQATTKQAAPKQAAPKQAAPKQAAPKQAAPKQAAPKQAAPKQATSPAKKPKTYIARTFDPLEYMTKKELDRVDDQFASALAGVDVVLFWTGIDWAHAQKWATMWNMKTLTVAMGPLMDSKIPSSPKAQKGKLSYSRYVKGASGRFAQYARQHCRVIVLTNPPPCIYSTRENNTYQELEEPILKGRFGGSPIRRIDYLHPTVDGAAHITYQVWPCDKTQDWAASFGGTFVNKWKKLNWSYKSLITTSQVELKLQHTQTRYRSSTTAIMPSGSCDQRASTPDGTSSVNKDLPKMSVNVTSIEYSKAIGEGITQMLKGVDALAADFDIEGHESRDLDPQSIPGILIGSDKELVETQVHDQLERGIDFQESGLLYESDCLRTTVYAIERCEPPASLVAVPVININDLTVGVEVTIEIEEHGQNKDFLYLTMNTDSELKCWKLRWAEREKIETRKHGQDCAKTPRF